jgi:hypothetical protein
MTRKRLMTPAMLEQIRYDVLNVLYRMPRKAWKPYEILEECRHFASDHYIRTALAELVAEGRVIKRRVVDVGGHVRGATYTIAAP